MESIARFMVASTDLLEAEARVFKRAAVRLSMAAGAAIVALALILVGLAFLSYGIFVFVAMLLHSYPGAALLFGAIAIGGAAFALLTAKKLVV